MFPAPPVASVENRTIPGPAGAIPVRVYRDTDPTEQGRPVLAWFHGGGHVIGSLDTHDAMARHLCREAACVVVSVDYRMGPEHPFPAAVDDCVAAVRWLAEHGREIGVDPGRLAVGGDSAGGNLAAVAALTARDEGGPALRHQLLVYPVTDYRCRGPSYERYARGYGTLEAESMRWFRRHYLGGPDGADDWRASPLLAADLSGLPPALVITAECDVLRDEGVAYAERLAESGTPCEHAPFPGMIHGFFGLLGIAARRGRGPCPRRPRPPVRARGLNGIRRPGSGGTGREGRGNGGRRAAIGHGRARRIGPRHRRRRLPRRRARRPRDGGG